MYTSGLVVQQGAAMAVAGHLAALRHQVAVGQGHASHADSALQGSAVGTSAAAVAFLEQFASGLQPYVTE